VPGPTCSTCAKSGQPRDWGDSALLEATGCGGSVLSEDRPPIRDFSASGREVAAFDSGEAFVERVRCYVSHREERAGTSDRSYARAQREHTYELRLKTMFEILGFTTGACEPAEKVGTSRREQ